MKTLFFTLALIIVLSTVLFYCNTSSDIPSDIKQDYPLKFTVEVKNDTNLDRKDELISFDVKDIQSQHQDFNPMTFVIFDGAKELPSQVLDSDGDGNFAKVLCLADFAPGEKKKLMVYYAREGEKKRSYPKRTQAELSYKFGGEFKKNKEGRYEYLGGQFKNMDYLRVPPQHSDHSWYIRYEGPGWESDKVGYRFYLDWRNATDIFGKKTPEMVLQNVGLDGFDSYHEMSDWGMDILKVGDALGIGGIGMWDNNMVQRVSKTDSVTCRIVANGPIYSQIRTIYYGWQVAGGKFDLVSNLSISAGSRLTRHDVTISGEPQNLCTGIVKHEGVTIIKNSPNNSDWEYLATYGKQSLAGDQLGMAVLYRKADVQKITDDQNNYVAVLDPSRGKLQYYFLAAWEQEPEGITSESQFKDYLQNISKELSQPVKITW
jgi:hypothetical protein